MPPLGNAGPHRTRRPPDIGRPLRNTHAYIVDSEFEPAPIGVVGELCIGGIGVALGYLNRPALTAERFVGDPFSGVPGSRLYRTGDLARFRSDGRIEYVGRADDQVKVRGYRIELGEIENALLAQPGVAQAAVKVLTEENQHQRLVAYVVPRAQQGDGVPKAQLSLSELREGLLRWLPDYMLPSAFVILEALPRTLNGKVDRKALPAPDIAHLRKAQG